MLDFGFFNIDCMEGMKQFPDGYFELAIVDPPYGIGADTKNSYDGRQSPNSASKSKKYGDQRWDGDVPTKDYFVELKRVSKHQIVWGINYYAEHFGSGRIYWHKNVTMPTYSDGELAYCSKLNSVKYFEYTWHGMLQENMKDKEVRIHPTQKPIALYEWLLSNYAKPNDKILDTHVGSASSLIACENLGFQYVGFELDKDYYDAATKRIEDSRKQIKLIEPEQEIEQSQFI